MFIPDTEISQSTSDKKKSSLCQYFLSDFGIEIADTEEQLNEVFRIRYQVYCQELGYEPVENFPDGMERDSYDKHSIHFLLKHKASQSSIGCVRAVLADPQQRERPFPFEKICHHNIKLDQVSRNGFFEISRLAVISQFRKRKGESQTAGGLIFFDQEQNTAAQNNRRQYPIVPLSLYLACTSLAIIMDINAFTLMEKRLARHLRRCGIPAIQIGDFVDYHGQRGPFLLDRQDVLTKMKLDIREFFDCIHSDVSSRLWSAPALRNFHTS